ncbi:uncharacterized protein LOC123300841 [Chrysoperla carnea]|uniref:uncharacterized protein LOC123300841 n=1 Tax=Chrysoperla carnea TaxID=189513 RepID=UPI001D083D9D|nr:uncharacterized protein LOC123300841 [Chrysoperla carnea]
MVRYCFICKEYYKADMYHRFPVGGDMRKKWLDAFGFEEDDVFRNTLVCSNHFENDCYHVPNHLTGNKVLKKGSIPSLLLAVQMVKKTPRKIKLDFDGESSNTAVGSTSNMELFSDNYKMELVSTETPRNKFVSTDNSKMEFVTAGNESIRLEESTSSKLFGAKSANTDVEPPSSIELPSISSEMEFIAPGSSVLKTSITQKRWRPAYVSQVDMEHEFDIPRHAKSHSSLAVDKIQKKKIIALNRDNRLLKARVKNLETFLNHLKSKNLISEEAYSNIQNTLSTSTEKMNIQEESFIEHDSLIDIKEEPIIDIKEEPVDSIQEQYQPIDPLSLPNYEGDSSQTEQHQLNVYKNTMNMVKVEDVPSEYNEDAHFRNDCLQFGNFVGIELQKLSDYNSLEVATQRIRSVILDAQNGLYKSDL